VCYNLRNLFYQEFPSQMQLGLHYTTCGYQQQSALQFSKLKCPPTDASYMSPPFCIVNTITPSAYFTFAKLLRHCRNLSRKFDLTILNRSISFSDSKPLPYTLVRLLEIRCSVAITCEAYHYVRRRLHFQPPSMINPPLPTLGKIT
jgi:hypothetical protein